VGASRTGPRLARSGRWRHPGSQEISGRLLRPGDDRPAARTPGKGQGIQGQSPLTQNLTTQNVGSEFVGHVRAGLVEHVVVFVIVVRGGAIREDHPTDEDVKLLRIRNMVDIPQRLVLAG